MPKLKIKTAWIRNERAQHKREMGNPMLGIREQAERYALWLCERDGIEIHPESLRVCIVTLRVGRRSEKRAQFFKAITIDGADMTGFYPHWDFVQPDAVEHHDDQLIAA